ncbi:MAG: hypothetical protein K2R93_19620 [Gemmatimonadaceae bacterium]|nr:hypothetical protein [Gemmatimonadaceae bacterium]
MSYTLIFSALLLMAVLAATVGGSLWWVQRPLAYSRAPRGTVLPLFSNEQGVVWHRPSDDEPAAVGRPVVGRGDA